MDISSIGPVTYRALISLFTLFIVTKILGKKQVSELSLFDYVIGISIGNFAAEMTINVDSNEFNGIWAVILFGIVAYIISFISMKSVKLRRIMRGTPTIIIQDGNILKNNMKKVHLEVNELLEECRIKGYFDISQIAFAVMEVNGEMSFLPKSDYRPIVCKDMDISNEKTELLGIIIIDGKVLHSNLHLMNKDEEWLNRKLVNEGIQDIKDILLCTLDKDEKVIIYKNNNTIKSLDIIE